MAHTDPAGRPYVRLTDLKVGDQLEHGIFESALMPDKTLSVLADVSGRLYVPCWVPGKFYLDAQTEADGYVIGFYKK